MTNKEEFLYTDIAIQLFNVFAEAGQNDPDENKEVLSTFFESISDEYKDNPFFLSALLYAFMMHLNIVFHSIAEVKEVNVDDVRMLYIKHYNDDVRPFLSKSMVNMPSKYKDVMKLLDTENDTRGKE
jgi:hypothetical protein